MAEAGFTFEPQGDYCRLKLVGDWQLGHAPDGESLCKGLSSQGLAGNESHGNLCHKLVIDTEQLGGWDSSLTIALLPLMRQCKNSGIDVDDQHIAPGLQNLLRLATDVPAYETTPKTTQGFFHAFHDMVEGLGREVKSTLIFIGDTYIALRQWIKGEAKTRRSDILFFIRETGPKALPIVTLISTSVGMILAYLGSVQLRQLGAQVYVANLVSLGMVREMGALMTAIILAGRTGAAYAAQLGTMQANEEIDALKTMGISSMEFLVLPRLLALIFVVPLLCVYADVIGLAGGALVASGMDVSFKQYILQTQGAVDWADIFTGLFKSLVFAVLIAIAGCQAGLNCGRSSTAVGVATTNAVVRAIVYLILADAAFNILYDKLGI